MKVINGHRLCALAKKVMLTVAFVTTLIDSSGIYHPQIISEANSAMLKRPINSACRLRAALA